MNIGFIVEKNGSEVLTFEEIEYLAGEFFAIGRVLF